VILVLWFGKWLGVRVWSEVCRSGQATYSFFLFCEIKRRSYWWSLAFIGQLLFIYGATCERALEIHSSPFFARPAKMKQVTNGRGSHWIDCNKLNLVRNPQHTHERWIWLRAHAVNFSTGRVCRAVLALEKWNCVRRTTSAARDGNARHTPIAPNSARNDRNNFISTSCLSHISLLLFTFQAPKNIFILLNWNLYCGYFIRKNLHFFEKTSDR